LLHCIHFLTSFLSCLAFVGVSDYTHERRDKCLI
jgi:hypothetical protein